MNRSVDKLGRPRGGRPIGPAKGLAQGNVPMPLLVAFREKAARQGVTIGKAMEAALTLWVGDPVSGDADNFAMQQFQKLARIRNELAKVGVSASLIDEIVGRLANKDDEYCERYVGAFRDMYKGRKTRQPA